MGLSSSLSHSLAGFDHAQGIPSLWAPLLQLTQQSRTRPDFSQWVSLELIQLFCKSPSMFSINIFIVIIYYYNNFYYLYIIIFIFILSKKQSIVKFVPYQFHFTIVKSTGESNNLLQNKTWKNSSSSCTHISKLQVIRRLQALGICLNPSLLCPDIWVRLNSDGPHSGKRQVRGRQRCIVMSVGQTHESITLDK